MWWEPFLIRYNSFLWASSHFIEHLSPYHLAPQSLCLYKPVKEENVLQVSDFVLWLVCWVWFVVTEYLRPGGLNSKPVYLGFRGWNLRSVCQHGWILGGRSSSWDNHLLIVFSYAETREGIQVLRSLVMRAPIPSCGFHTHDLLPPNGSISK